MILLPFYFNKKFFCISFNSKLYNCKRKRKEQITQFTVWFQNSYGNVTYVEIRLGDLPFLKIITSNYNNLRKFPIYVEYVYERFSRLRHRELSERLSIYRLHLLFLKVFVIKF